MPQPIGLCIIDMQPHFSNTAHYIVKQVVRQVKLAQRRRAPIIVVEYDGRHVGINCGETFWPIRNAFKGYDRVYTCTKRSDDGSKEIKRIIDRNDLTTRWRCVGVNTDACVNDTVFGLVELGIRVHVSESATNTASYHAQCEGIGHLRVNGIRISV